MQDLPSCPGARTLPPPFRAGFEMDARKPPTIDGDTNTNITMEEP